MAFGRSAPIQVPYVCHRTFSGSILDYPERQGWDRNALYKGDFTSHGFEETRALLQEWLFFGPLFHIFDVPGIDFDVEDFIRRDEHRETWVTTAKLPLYAQKWYFRLGLEQHQGGRTVEQKKADFQHINKCLRMIHRFVLRYCGKDSQNGKLYPPSTFWPLSPEISLSIIVLADSITKIGFEGTGMSFNLDWGWSGLLYKRMAAAGWCPNLLSILTMTQEVGLMYSAESLGMPLVKKDHSNCDELVCKTDRVDEKTYETQHVIEGCGCKFEGPRTDDVVKILDRGGIPVVKCHGKGDALEVHVFEHMTDENDGKYVAISHVCKYFSKIPTDYPCTTSGVEFFARVRRVKPISLWTVTIYRVDFHKEP